MKVDVAPGKYVVAVSGGVDSMALLDLLSKVPRLHLVVAHFDHGIRPDSQADEQLVAKAAKGYGLKFEAGQGRLGKDASEEAARTARYEFLEQVKDKHNAKSVITAHHQDDLIETALINILRGTGPQGLVALQSNPKILRPLLPYSKTQIYSYAKKQKISWHEDATNLNTDYLRNYVRTNLVPKLSANQRAQILSNVNQIAKSKRAKDQLLRQLASGVGPGGQISRAKFIGLPSEVANELIVHWFRQLGVRDFDRKLVNRVNILIRTAKPGTVHNIKKPVDLNVSKLTAQFSTKVYPN